MAHIQMIPPSLIALNEEICNHPKLQERLAKHADTDAELQNAKCLAEIGKYCGIVLDDWYTPADIIKIADIMVVRLKKMRAEIISTVSTDNIVVPPTNLNQTIQFSEVSNPNSFDVTTTEENKDGNN